MKENEKGDIYEFCMKQSCCKVCPKLERCPFEERNKIPNIKKTKLSDNNSRKEKEKQISK